MRYPSIKEQIGSGKNQIISDSSLKLQGVIKIDDDVLVLNTGSILTPYRMLIKNYISTYTLSDSDIKKYEYKPERLCYDVYGTIELTPLILQINNMESATKFCNLEKGIKLFNSSIIDFLNEVIIKEKKRISVNRNNVNKDINR